MEEWIPVFFVGMIFGAILSGFGMYFDVRNFLHDQAIERGYALYCPTTGDFAWKGECDGR